MSRLGALCYLICFILLFGVLGGVAGNRAVLATQETSNGSFLSSLNADESPEDKLELICKYPVLEGNSGDSFEFSVELRWRSSESREFDLVAAGPPGWSTSILGGYEKKRIGGRMGLVPMRPGETFPVNTVTVEFAPLEGTRPEPGEYAVTLEVSSGDIKEAITIKAVVTAIYRFTFYTADWRLNTEVTAGEDTHLTVMLQNTGTAAVKKISFTSSKPSDWNITFNPKEVDSLEPGMAQELDVVINPLRKTIAGDYQVTLRANSKDLPTEEIELRVTALTPTIWGWVAILIVLAVIAGLGVIFRRLGRR